MEYYFPQPIFPFPSEDHILEKGEHSPLVYILQGVLKELSADYVTPKAPAMTSTSDKATVQSVQHWQQVVGLPTNGVVDRFIWDMLAELYNARLT